MHKYLIFIVALFSGVALSSDYSYLLYQESEDVKKALQFIGAPDENIEKLGTFIKGGLANQALVEYANQIIEARETRSAEMFKRLTDPESLSRSSELFNATLEKIRDGSLIYGNNGYKYFVTTEPVADRLLSRFFSHNVNKPSVTLIFYHYHPSNGALIGSTMYLTETDGGYRNVLPVRTEKTMQDNTPGATQ